MELFTSTKARISLLRRQLAAGEVDALLLRANGNIQQPPHPTPQTLMRLQGRGRGYFYFPWQVGM